MSKPLTLSAIADRLRDAVEVLDYSAAWLEGDADALADIESVITKLTELRRELEMAPFKTVLA